ncbi:hypothetical protein EDE09_11334 [Neorhizobium sp. S3-V5DH]|nr:hypothetical protein EDE09_11334 [Neorhizobium sp. S3-V5DH]
MPAMVREHRGYRIAIYSPSSHFAVVTAPGSNRVLDLQEKSPDPPWSRGRLSSWIAPRRGWTISRQESGQVLPSPSKLRGVKLAPNQSRR